MNTNIIMWYYTTNANVNVYTAIPDSSRSITNTIHLVLDKESSMLIVNAIKTQHDDILILGAHIIVLAVVISLFIKTFKR